MRYPRLPPTLRRRLPLLLSLVWLGCSEAGTPVVPPPPPAPPKPTAVVLSPNQVTLGVLGDSVRIEATVRDQYGRVMPGYTVTWGSTAPDVATAAQSGVVTAVENGFAKVWGAVGALSDTALVTVSDPLGYEYAPDRAALMAFYRAANGPLWTNKFGWGDERVPMAEWYGVTTAFDSVVNRYRVERLHLRDNNLRGTRLPLALTQLARLRAVDLLEAVWSEGPARRDTPEYFRCGLRQRQGPPLCQPDSAYPPELMDLPLLDSLRLGRDLCVPAADTTLRNWLWSRDHYPYLNDGREVPFRKAKDCLGPDDVAEVSVVLVQAVDMGDTLLAGRDAWIAARPKGKNRHRPTSFSDDEATYLTGNMWPAHAAEACLGAACSTVELAQSSHDSTAYMLSTDLSSSFAATETIPPGGNSWWHRGVSAALIPGKLVQPGVTITLTLESRTVGDTVAIWQRTLTPTVLDALPRLDITLVAMVSPNSECRRSVRNGGGKTENCYEWPDSTILLDEVQGNEDQVLFQELRHWFPVGEINYRWHDELLESRVWDRLHSVSEAAHDDLRRLANMADDDGRYWIGIGCLIGDSCNLGFGGPAGLAYLDGRFSVTVPNGSTLAHELGHNLGLIHPDESDWLPDNLEALAIGKWKRTHHNGRWWFNEYHADPVHEARPTFMESKSSPDTQRDGEGIAPWQLRRLLWRLTAGTAPAGRPTVVVN